MGGLPSGTVTFLFTDVEGSTASWERAPGAMREALVLHDEVVRSCVERRDGVVFATGGDGFAVVFSRVRDALDAAAEAQAALGTTAWPEGTVLRVRIGAHVGEADERGGDYFGPAVNKAARIAAAGHGGQIVVSSTVAELVPDLRFVPLGHHRLPGFASLDELWQVGPGDFPPLRSIRHEGNLPAPASTFIGREREAAELRALLEGRRLVTLVGVGGVGKTRLAIEVARTAAPRFPDGVWFVDLSPRRSDDGVVEATLAALGASAEVGVEPFRSLIDHLSHRRALLVMDNCEHLLDGAASVGAALLAEAPEVTLVATSREPLGVSGEQVWVMPSLAEAAELFIDRARLGSSAFDPSPAEIELIASVCERLDGIPLAVELAAARTRSMTVAEIGDALHDRFRLLRSSGRGGVERHQTLQATVQWSYDMLSEEERQLFDHLSVFPATFDAAAAVAICGPLLGLDGWALRDGLDRLLDRSLLESSRSGDTTRFRLLETLRQFGEQGLDHEAALALKRAHLTYFTDVAGELMADFYDTDDPVGDERWDAERDNVVAAMHWALVDEDHHACARLADACDRALWTGDVEIQEWLLDAAADPDAEVVTLAGAASTAGVGGRGDVAESLELARRAVAADPTSELALQAFTSALYLVPGKETDCADAADAWLDRIPKSNPSRRVVALGLKAVSLAAVAPSRSDAAMDQLEATVAAGVSPRVAGMANNLEAEWALRRGNPARALECSSRALVDVRADHELDMTVRGAFRHRAWAMSLMPDVDPSSALLDACLRPAETGWWSEVWRTLAVIGRWWVTVGRLEPVALIVGCATALDIQMMELDELITATVGTALAPARERGRHMTRTDLLEEVAAELAPATAGGRISA
jgi:predicted ATPase/class 3 adenylate cyclase